MAGRQAGRRKEGRHKKVRKKETLIEKNKQAEQISNNQVNRQKNRKT